MVQVLQFGEGNFLRAFAQDYFQSAGINVAICQPRSNTKIINALKAQNGKYDIIIKGRLNGKIVNDRKHITCVEKIIDSVNEYNLLLNTFVDNNVKYIISNTTEAGICYVKEDQTTFPAKITKLLYERYKSGSSPLTFLPVELIENNADKLKECIIKYAADFGFDMQNYINDCHFYNTLVDRIVTGHIDDEDACSVCCEPYKSWIIESDVKLPFDATYTDNLDLYRTRKVRILNGCHTMFVLPAIMCNFSIVRDVVNDVLFTQYINIGLSQIKQTINIDTTNYIKSVLDRFNNPYIDHKLVDISLNSVAKFKTRCLCTIIDYYKLNNTPPSILTFAFASLIYYYKNYNANDDRNLIDYFINNDISDILNNIDLWGVDLSNIKPYVIKYFNNIVNNGIYNALQEVVNENL